jgi:protein required for attachment to host cells/predicted Zn-ribbon and HTH transcriptional regulator
MMPMTRQELEILLDSPDQKGYVVSAYVDLTVKDGFHHFVEHHLKNQAKAAHDALGRIEAAKELDANIEAIRRVVREHTGNAAKGLAVFSSVTRGLCHVVPLRFQVENRLVINDEPYILPLLEHWYGEPVYLITLVDSDEAHLFESFAGVVEPVRDVERPDVDEPIERDKPRFTYKKRFAQTRHERLHGTDEDKFLQDVAALIGRHWQSGRFSGLILLGQSAITGPLRRLLPKEVQQEVVDEAPLAMTTRADQVAEEVGRVIARWHAERDQRVLAELGERWKQKYLVANGPTEVLDALQQGRANLVVAGSRRDLDGARCPGCGYRFGAPIEFCVYCQSRCHKVSAMQEILRMALRHRVAVHLFRKGPDPDPLAKVGGVAALLRAEANWAPDPATANASEGH